MMTQKKTLRSQEKGEIMKHKRIKYKHSTPRAKIEYSYYEFELSGLLRAVIDLIREYLGLLYLLI